MKLNKSAKKLLWGEFKKRKLKVIGFLSLNILAGVLEAVGIGMIFPFIYILVNPSSIHNFKILKWITNTFGVFNQNTLTIFLLASIVTLIAFKLCYMLFIRYLEMKVMTNWKTSLATRLMKTYIYSSYDFFVNKGSAHILRNISIIKIIYDQYVMSFFKISVALSIIFGLLTILAIILPIGALAACAIFGLSLTLIYKFTKLRFRNIGEEASILHLQRGRILAKSLGGIKETKVFGRESFFINKFREIEYKYFSNQHIYNFLSSLPPLIVETGIVLGIMSLILFYIYNNQHGHALAVLSLLLVVMFRALPQINKLLVSIHLINRSTNDLNIIAEELDLYESKSNKMATFDTQEKLSFKNKITFVNIAYKYENSETDEYALENVNAVILKGQFIGITGHSAAGKSTLINLLLGLLTPSRGEILIDDLNLNSKALERKWLNNIGYVPQSIYILEDSIVSNIAYGVNEANIDIERIYEVMRMSGLTDLLNDNPKCIYQSIGENGVRLSGGQRQRIGIARALYNDPEILILDEASANIDATSESNILDTITNLPVKKTIIMISHRIFTLERCDNIFIFDHGRLVSQGTFKELSMQCDVFKRLLEKSRKTEKTQSIRSAVEAS